MNSLLSQKLGTNQSHRLHQIQTEKTFSLTMLFNNVIDLNIKEIIPFYDEIDKSVFDHKMQTLMIFSEYNKFEDLSQLENQRIVLHYNKSSTVLAGYIPKTQKLVVMKQLSIDSQEMFICMLDEYKIHFKINKLFPSESLELMIPVIIQKTSKSFDITAIMEKASFNLFEYSKNHQINEGEAKNIFFQLIDQIINLHSVNIAHRDLKPQNIFYVINKGWLLSDYGESLEYDQAEGLYNIRGTKYFLMPGLQLNIHNNSKINQNLLQNDLYALVVSMIMIQNQQYINDMHDQIMNLKDNLLKKVLKLESLEKLKQFRDKFNFQNDINIIDLTKQCQKQLSSDEQIINQACNFLSQMQYVHEQISQNADQSWIQKLIKLIKSNLRFIIKRFSKSVGFALINLSLSIKTDLRLQLNKRYIKTIQNKPPSQQEFYIQMLFLYGYTEKTITLANEFLKTNYSQSIHLVLIDSYHRANMPEEADSQLRKFTEGLVFDQLNTNSQIQYLQYLEQFFDDQMQYNISFDFNAEKELIDRGQIKTQVYVENLQQQIEQLSQNYYQNKKEIVNAFFDSLDRMCIDFCITNMSFCKIALSLALEQPIYVLLPLIQKIYQQNYGQFDTNRKLIFLQEIAEILLLLNQKLEFMQNLKLIKQSVFDSESWEQTINFQIIQFSIEFMEYQLQCENCKINIELLSKKIVKLLKLINTIKFVGYRQYILATLQNLIQNFQQYGILVQNHNLVYIVLFIINLTFQQNYHKLNDENYQFFHIYSQCILIDIRNDKRCQLIVNEQKRFLNHEAIQVFKQKKLIPLNLLIKPSIKNLLRIEEIESKEIQKIIKQQFLLNIYMNQ